MSPCAFYRLIAERRSAYLDTGIGTVVDVASRSGERSARRQAMETRRSGSQPSGQGPAESFTGTVRIDPPFAPPDPARVVGALVTFEPGARTGRTLSRRTTTGRIMKRVGASAVALTLAAAGPAAAQGLHVFP